LLSTPPSPSALRSSQTAFEALAALRSHQQRLPPAPYATGFAPLDEVLQGGLRAGDLALLGGKPGQGKTTLALQWARNLAVAGRPTVFACYEHDVVALLVRLLLCELGEIVGASHVEDELRLETLRDRVRGLLTGRQTPNELLGSDPLLRQAEERVRAYGDRLLLVPASGAHTDLGALTRLVEHHAATGGGALFVDYLQKVPLLDRPADEAERVTRVTEGLKELALRSGLAVVALTATDHAGLVDRRLHLHHLRGSTALAYEADVVLVLNEKLDIVSRLHLAYDTTRTHEFRGQVVFSVEKNRTGLADVHLEFRKDFANYRFDPAGRWVSERLWDQGAPEE
jgi:replicative DNA helicase